MYLVETKSLGLSHVSVVAGMSWYTYRQIIVAFPACFKKLQTNVIFSKLKILDVEMECHVQITGMFTVESDGVY